MGLSARALENTPAWPTYPNPLTGTQIGAGLAGPFAATAILGHAGAAMCKSPRSLSVSMVIIFTLF